MTTEKPGNEEIASLKELLAEATEAIRKLIAPTFVERRGWNEEDRCNGAVEDLSTLLPRLQEKLK